MDPSRRKLLIYLGGALLLIAVALLVVFGSMQQAADEPTSIEDVPKPPDLGLPGSGLITDTPEATASPDASDASLSSSDAAALEAELSAIEESLDSMSMPDDADFKDIESGLQ